MENKFLYPLVSFIAIFISHIIYSICREIQISHQCVQPEGISPLFLYFGRQDYFLGISYAMSGAFTIYAFLKYLENYRHGIAGMLCGITLSGFLYFIGCFFVGCCGSPMLGIYLGLFGSTFLGFTKPLVLILTTISVTVGFFWLEKKTRGLKCCCVGDEKCRETDGVSGEDPLEKIQSELQEGIGLIKCRKCGCMKETLESLMSSFSSLQTAEALDLLKNIESWLTQMKPIKYACLGCEHCYPAVATNIFHQTFPEIAETRLESRGSETREKFWPPVPGEYTTFCDGQGCPVAVSTLASIELSERLSHLKPRELCIVGKTETENIGVEKVIRNTITNPTIHYLLLAGKDPEGHHSGQTLLALGENGVDENMRVIQSPGKWPVLKNITREEVDTFRNRVQIVNMIGCEDVRKIVEKLKELSKGLSLIYSCEKRTEETRPIHILTVPIIQAKEPTKVEMDKAGYFVILPRPEKGIITVEHYSYDNKLQRAIEGRDARSIYSTIIENGWVTQLSHAAYLGKELAKAEFSMKLGFKYVQDGA